MVNRSRVALVHSAIQDFVYNNPNTLLPYLAKILGGCTIAGVEREAQLTDDYGNQHGSVDILVTVNHQIPMLHVPVEVKSSRPKGSMEQLRDYATFIDNCSDYGLVLVGNRSGFLVRSVDLKGSGFADIGRYKLNAHKSGA